MLVGAQKKFGRKTGDEVCPLDTGTGLFYCLEKRSLILPPGGKTRKPSGVM